ncbi:hypothetical protein L1987_38287 [Smallanthus sonchifolius]|uniref:Uncharacterized protein n=1 Tax=Smallanthus sonchifolius TaxID=185202 RepID=A0ACB9HK05_9ASTR|nr:hypothetical protein L1987_38287 [Smallanthus sonchifolius]
MSYHVELATLVFGFTISGARQTAVAVMDDEGRGREIGERMMEAFMMGRDLKVMATVKKLDRVGASLVNNIFKTIIKWFGMMGKFFQGFLFME